ncbi:ATP-grasp domain-containing protein, partial [Streptomyces rubiginosohelvolus]
MRSHAVEAGISVPGFTLVSKVEEIPDAARAIGFPVIVKPTMGSCSQGTMVVSDEAALSRRGETVTHDVFGQPVTEWLSEQYVRAAKSPSTAIAPRAPTRSWTCGSNGSRTTATTTSPSGRRFSSTRTIPRGSGCGAMCTVFSMPTACDATPATPRSSTSRTGLSHGDRCPAAGRPRHGDVGQAQCGHPAIPRRDRVLPRPTPGAHGGASAFLGHARFPHPPQRRPPRAPGRRARSGQARRDPRFDKLMVDAKPGDHIPTAKDSTAIPVSAYVTARTRT